MKPVRARCRVLTNDQGLRSAAQVAPECESPPSSLGQGIQRRTGNQRRSARVLEHAEEINKQLNRKHKLRPFSNLKGLAGRAGKLDKRTSRFILKRMGFAIA